MDVQAIEEELRTVDLMPLPIQAKPAVDPVVHLEAIWRDVAGLKALILRFARDPEAAADLLQDAAVTTIEKLRAGEIANPESIGGYLYRVALNHFRNYRRKDRSALTDSDAIEQLADENADSAALDLDRARWAAEVRRILESMPQARDRELLIRFYLNGEDKATIAASLNLSDEHFNRVIFRARERFRLLLEREGTFKADIFAVLLTASLALLAGTTLLAGPLAGVLQ
jgi:RNA polymerase sigma-70 factor (ECF subfamily)